ncbi:hypothetical protein ACH4MG_04120 [Streptomyces sp. NPDC017454]|uniref:hypothetical protein n=1 Tax=Streptomyces sp. NPDC017454 TaxID=3364997 RepID=UPI00379BF399
MNGELVTVVVLGLVVNEFCDLSPWLARRTIRLAARAVPDREVRRRLEEEWAAGLQGRPGKILKLFSAFTILVSAVTSVRGLYLPEQPRFSHTRRFLSGFIDREGRIVMATSFTSCATDLYLSPWRNGTWSLPVTMLVFLVVVNATDHWWQARKARQTREAG